VHHPAAGVERLEGRQLGAGADEAVGAVLDEQDVVALGQRQQRPPRRQPDRGAGRVGVVRDDVEGPQPAAERQLGLDRGGDVGRLEAARALDDRDDVGVEEPGGAADADVAGGSRVGTGSRRVKVAVAAALRVTTESIAWLPTSMNSLE
jgi:hypothetical protein